MPYRTSPSTANLAMRISCSVLLQVSLDLIGRPRCRAGRVLAELAPGPALPEQVPALIQRLLGRAQLDMLVLAGQLALGQPVSQLMLGLNQLVNVTEDVLVVHSRSFLSHSRTATSLTPDPSFHHPPGGSR